MEDVEGSGQFVIHVQNGSDVSASVAVVWCRPNSDKVLISEPILESVHNKLMCSGDQRNVVDVIEFGGDLGSEEPSRTSWGHGPGLDVLWVRPHKVAEWTLVRNFHSSVDESNLINSLDFWGESSMNAENFSFNDGSDTKIIEDFCAVLPWVGISVLSNGLIIEAVDGGDLSGLVISSKEGDVSWVLQLQAKQELEGLDRVEPSVNEVAHEDVPRVWNLATLVEKF